MYIKKGGYKQHVNLKRTPENNMEIEKGSL